MDETATLDSNFTDHGCDTWTAYIDWENDGIYDTVTTNPITHHSYLHPANYTIRLMVFDYAGNMDSDTMRCLVKYNITVQLRLGDTYIAILEETTAASIAMDLEDGDAILYWNATTQQYSSSYIVGVSGPTDPDNHNFNPGDHAILSTNGGKNIQLKGFEPKSQRYLRTGDNWIGRTDDNNIQGYGNNIWAHQISENLSHCSGVLYWDAYNQVYSPTYIDGFSTPYGPDDFIIKPGMAICIIMSQNEYLNQYGW